MIVHVCVRNCVVASVPAHTPFHLARRNTLVVKEDTEKTFQIFKTNKHVIGVVYFS